MVRSLVVVVVVGWLERGSPTGGDGTVEGASVGVTSVTIG